MNPCVYQSNRRIFVVLPLLTAMMIVDCGSGWCAEIKPKLGQEKIHKVDSARQKNASSLPADESRVEIERLNKPAPRKKAKEKVGNAFGATSWYVPPPPPPPVKPVPPPPPSAPPMPFSFLGLYEEGAVMILMLLKGGHVYTVAVGDIVENTYRIDRIQNGVVEMTYLPLNIKQSINTGSSS